MSKRVIKEFAPYSYLTKSGNGNFEVFVIVKLPAGYVINTEPDDQGEIYKDVDLNDGDCMVPKGDWKVLSYKITQVESAPADYYIDRFEIQDHTEYRGIRIATKSGAEKQWDTDIWFCDADNCPIQLGAEVAIHAPYVYLFQYAEGKFYPYLIIPRDLLRGKGYFTPAQNKCKQTIKFKNILRAAGFEYDDNYYTNKRQYEDASYIGKYSAEVEVPTSKYPCSDILNDPKRRTTVRSRNVDNPITPGL